MKPRLKSRVTFVRVCAGEYLASLDGNDACWLYWNPHDRYWYPQPVDSLADNVLWITEDPITTQTLKELKAAVRESLLETREPFDLGIFDYDDS